MKGDIFVEDDDADEENVEDIEPWADSTERRLIVVLLQICCKIRDATGKHLSFCLKQLGNTVAAIDMPVRDKGIEANLLEQSFSTEDLKEYTAGGQRGE